MIGHIEGDTIEQLGEARRVFNVLGQFYPGHPWSVRVMPGIIFIRHLDFPADGWGMCLKTNEIDYDAAVLKKQIIMKAGEWLEMANMKRGRADADQEHGWVEGVPERFKPKPLSDDVKVIITPDTFRTKPHGLS